MPFCQRVVICVSSFHPARSWQHLNLKWHEAQGGSCVPCRQISPLGELDFLLRNTCWKLYPGTSRFVDWFGGLEVRNSFQGFKSLKPPIQTTNWGKLMYDTLTQFLPGWFIGILHGIPSLPSQVAG